MRKTKKGFAGILEEAENEAHRKMRAKVPEWADVQGLSFPSQLNIEQCSSSLTAMHKAHVITTTLGGIRRIADLTGGLGVDAWAFAQIAEEVLHNEADSRLSEAVKANFAVLNLTNVCFRNSYIEQGSIRTTLGSFKPDLIFLDPARRSASGKKCFLLEDCSPDLTSIMDELTEACGTILVKLSPMADITMLRRRLGNVSSIHVTGASGECKELLFLLTATPSEKCRIFVSECRRDADGKPHFISLSAGTEEIRESGCGILTEDVELEGKWLFDPSSTLLKSGCHDLFCGRKGMLKFSPFTHCYISERIDGDLSEFGRFRHIEKVVTLNKRTMKEVASSYPKAEVTAKNIHLSSDELRARLGVKSGTDAHIYGLASGPDSERKLLVITAH